MKKRISGVRSCLLPLNKNKTRLNMAATTPSVSFFLNQ